MRLIGYWIESLNDLDYFPPQEFVGGLSLSTRAEVADYLDTGLKYAAYRGVSWCRFFLQPPDGQPRVRGWNLGLARRLVALCAGSRHPTPIRVYSRCGI